VQPTAAATTDLTVDTAMAAAIVLTKPVVACPMSSKSTKMETLVTRRTPAVQTSNRERRKSRRCRGRSGRRLPSLLPQKTRRTRHSKLNRWRNVGVLEWVTYCCVLFLYAKVSRICSLQQTVRPSMEKVMIHCGQEDSTSYLHEAFVLVLCIWKTKRLDTPEIRATKSFLLLHTTCGVPLTVMCDMLRYIF
jgi:hypothetical protein